MVCAYAFARGEAGRAIDFHEAAALLSAPGPRGGFLWLHFSLANSASERWLRRHTQLPAAFFEPQTGASTRLEVIDEALMGVLNDVQFFASEASAAATMTLHVSPHLLVTARTTALRAVDRLRAGVKAGEPFASPVELLAHLLRDQADVLVAIARDATTQVDGIEDDIISHQRGSRRQLGVIRRVLVRLQRLLAPEPAALFRLLSKPPAWLSENDLAELRNSAEELTAAVADSVALGERVRLLQEELTAIMGERTNETLFILTVVTVLALPLTIIPGLFGMNVGGVPFAERPAGFWLVVVLVAAVVGLGASLVSRLRNRH
jgi:zinc transporter